jgi:hypothetical protein
LGGFDVAVRGHPVAVSDGFTGDLRTIARQHVSATLGVVVGRRSSYLSQQSLGGQSDQEAERQTAKGAAVGLLTTPVRNRRCSDHCVLRTSHLAVGGSHGRQLITVEPGRHMASRPVRVLKTVCTSSAGGSLQAPE